MATNLTSGSDRASATIYQFPPRGRYAAGVRLQATPTTGPGLPHVMSPTIVGSGWYHEEAIRQERDRNE